MKSWACLVINKGCRKRGVSVVACVRGGGGGVSKQQQHYGNNDNMAAAAAAGGNGVAWRGGLTLSMAWRQ